MWIDICICIIPCFFRMISHSIKTISLLIKKIIIFVMKVFPQIASLSDASTFIKFILQSQKCDIYSLGIYTPAIADLPAHLSIPARSAFFILTKKTYYLNTHILFNSHKPRHYTRASHSARTTLQYEYISRASPDGRGFRHLRIPRVINLLG